MTTTTHSRPPRVRAIGLATALSAAGFLLTACGGDETRTERVEEDVYCTTEDGTVVDPDYCDENENDGHSGGFIWIGSFGGGHSPGYRLPVEQRTNSMRYNDSAARTKAGLPARGKFGTGGFGGKVTTTKTTTSKGGGFGGGKSSS